MKEPDDSSEESRGTWAMVGIVITIIFLMVYPVLEAKGLL